jgi:hypothetical protein
VAPVSSDDDLEDAVMIAAIAIGAVVLLGLVCIVEMLV